MVWGDPNDYQSPYDAVSLAGDALYSHVKGLTSVEMHPEMHATRVVKAEPLRKYRVWIRFADGTEGIADLGDFAGRGVFSEWDRPGGWEGMRVVHETLEWGSGDLTDVVDFCPEMLYSRVSGIGRADMETPDFARAALERLQSR